MVKPTFLTGMHSYYIITMLCILIVNRIDNTESDRGRNRNMFALKLMKCFEEKKCIITLSKLKIVLQLRFEPHEIGRSHVLGDHKIELQLKQEV